MCRNVVVKSRLGNQTCSAVALHDSDTFLYCRRVGTRQYSFLHLVNFTSNFSVSALLINTSTYLCMH